MSVNVDYSQMLTKVLEALEVIPGLTRADGLRVKAFGHWADLFFVPDADVGISWVADEPNPDPDTIFSKTERAMTATFAIAYKCDVALNSAEGLTRPGDATKPAGSFKLDALVRGNLGLVNVGTVETGPVRLRTRKASLLPHPDRANGTPGAVVLVRHFETTEFIG